MKLADDLMAESHVVGEWDGVRAHAARSYENRQSGQEQFRAWKPRKQRKSATWSVPDFSLTWGVNGYPSLIPNLFPGLQPVLTFTDDFQGLHEFNTMMVSKMVSTSYGIQFDRNASRFFDHIGCYRIEIL